MNHLKRIMRSSMNRMKSIFINITIVLISLILVFGLFEAFLIHENKWEAVERIPIEINGYNYRFVKSNSTLSPLNIKEGNRELFVIGDSFVAGMACAQKNSNFPSHLSKKITSGMDVVNLGMAGKNTADYVDFLEYFKISNGDLALITLYDNDIHVFERNCEQILRQSIKYDIHVPTFCTATEGFIDESNVSIFQKINNKIKRFRTIQLVKESLVQVPAFRGFFHRTNYRNDWNDFTSEENKWIRSSLRVMKEQILEKGGKAVFTYYPNTNRISINDERHTIWKRFIDFVEETDGIIISDPYPYFIENAEETSMVWSLTDKHPNCAAHKIMSEFIFTHLMQEIG